MERYFRMHPPGCPWVFYRLGHYGEYLPLGNFRRAWGRALKLAGIKDFRFHDTRHISASNMVDSGTPERVVMQVAGWRENMLDRYYHRAGRDHFSLIRWPA